MSRVSRALDKSFEELQTTAEKLLQQCPRLELMSFVRRMGLPVAAKNCHGIRYAKPGKQAQDAIDALKRAGVIELQPPTPIRESVLICRPGYQPPKPGSGYQTLVTSRIDPCLKGTWQPGDKPVRTRIDDIPTATSWRENKPSTPTETPTMSRTKENLERALAAVRKAEAAAIANGSYEMPSRNQLGLQIGLEDYFYAGTQGGKQATAEYRAAQARLDSLKKTQASPTKPGSVVQSPPTLLAPPVTLLSTTTTHANTPDPYQLRLKEEIDRLRAENEALKAQIKQAPTSSAETILEALREEEMVLRLDARDLSDRITELEQTRQQLIANADVIQRLIEQREAAIERQEEIEERLERTEAAFTAAIAETNGHKVLVGVAG